MSINLLLYADLLDKYVQGLFADIRTGKNVKNRMQRILKVRPPLMLLEKYNCANVVTGFLTFPQTVDVASKIMALMQELKGTPSPHQESQIVWDTAPELGRLLGRVDDADKTVLPSKGKVSSRNLPVDPPKQTNGPEQNKVTIEKDLKPIADNRKRESVKCEKDVVPNKFVKRTTRSTSTEEQKQDINARFNDYYKCQGKVIINSPPTTDSVVVISPKNADSELVDTPRNAAGSSNQEDLSVEIGEQSDKAAKGVKTGGHTICTRSKASPTQKENITNHYDHYYKSKGSVVGEPPRKKMTRDSKLFKKPSVGSIVAAEEDQSSAHTETTLPNSKTTKKNGTLPK